MSRKLARVPVAQASDQMFVRVPLPPELVAAVRERVDQIGELVAVGRNVFELALRLAADVEQDAHRARKAMDVRRRRRRPKKKTARGR